MTESTNVLKIQAIVLGINKFSNSCRDSPTLTIVKLSHLQATMILTVVCALSLMLLAYVKSNVMLCALLLKIFLTPSFTGQLSAVVKIVEPL